MPAWSGRQARTVRHGLENGCSCVPEPFQVRANRLFDPACFGKRGCYALTGLRGPEGRLPWAFARRTRSSPGYHMAGFQPCESAKLFRQGAIWEQPEGLPDGSRGWSEAASDTPGRPIKKILHPGGMPEFIRGFRSLRCAAGGLASLQGEIDVRGAAESADCPGAEEHRSPDFRAGLEHREDAFSITLCESVGHGVWASSLSLSTQVRSIGWSLSLISATACLAISS